MVTIKWFFTSFNIETLTRMFLLKIEQFASCKDIKILISQSLRYTI